MLACCYTGKRSQHYKYVCNVISSLPQTSIMAALRIYREKIRYLSSSEVVEQWREIFRTLNGDAFFPLKRWPEGMRLLFWKKPITDQQTFKLLMFCLICPWILLSQAWTTPDKAEKRALQNLSKRGCHAVCNEWKHIMKTREQVRKTKKGTGIDP